jgi:hypothetical protein
MPKQFPFKLLKLHTIVWNDDNAELKVMMMAFLTPLFLAAPRSGALYHPRNAESVTYIWPLSEMSVAHLFNCSQLEHLSLRAEMELKCRCRAEKTPTFPSASMINPGGEAGSKEF